MKGYSSVFNVWGSFRCLIPIPIITCVYIKFYIKVKPPESLLELGRKKNDQAVCKCNASNISTSNVHTLSISQMRWTGGGEYIFCTC